MDPFIVGHLERVSRTYAILVPMLPEGLADAVGAAYLLMRVVDTIEDDPRLTDDERLRCLDLLEAAVGKQPAELSGPLPAMGESDDERGLVGAAPRVLALLDGLEQAYRDPVCDAARTMIAGVRTSTARGRARGQPYPAVRDAAELREYCHCVAGVVGEMLCRMITRYTQLPAIGHQSEFAIDLGIGLQLVNIIKDAQADARRGRRYLPPPGPAGTDADVLRDALGQARESLRRGLDFVLSLPPAAGKMRAFCGLPIVWGAMTLARAEREPNHAKIDREAIRSSIETFEGLASDDRALRHWLTSLLWSSDEDAGAAGS